MIVDSKARRMLLAAAAADGAVALWRSPGDAAVRAALSINGLQRREVFGASNPQPCFAIARFNEAEPGHADAICADILISNGQPGFWTGSGYAPAPTTPEQQRLAQAASELSDAPLRAGAAPAPNAADPEAYRALVAAAIDRIGSGDFLKVVTSRAEPRQLAVGYDLLALFDALATLYPDAFVALVMAPGIGAWITATPEVLLTVGPDQDRLIARTMALAGTQWRSSESADEDLSSVLWPDKIIEEQALVSRYVRAAFAQAGIEAVEETGPRTVRAGALFHLRSQFAASLPQGRESALGALLAALHPTSAVCGMPKAPAAAFLAEREGYDRSFYTGYLGPVGFDGETALYVNLRSAQIIEETAYLYVGGGIVDGSVPETEWDETVAKTRTIGAVL